MVSMNSSSSPSFSSHYEPNYEEFSFEQSLLFSDSLKDLKNLRSQLYSAAEYFEVSYTNDDQKQTVVNTLKDFTINALVNTVDHLGSVTYKVTDLVDDRTDEVSGTELRVACIEQRLRTCQACMEHEGLIQQSLVMTTPKYHKRYIFPSKHEEENAFDSEHSISNFGHSLDSEDNRNQDHYMNDVQATIQHTQPTIRYQSPTQSRQSRTQSPQPPGQRGSFSFKEKVDKPKVSEKRGSSPLRSIFPLLRTGSLSSRPSTSRSSRPTTPNRSRSTTPTPSRPRTPTPSRPPTTSSSNIRSRNLPETRKSFSLPDHGDRNNQKDNEQYPSKSKRLFKALLSRRKTKHDEMLYTFLDEY
ncbi:hypothetical protein ACHQM5_011985 [Ranunculus cassubicifolius]